MSNGVANGGDSVEEVGVFDSTDEVTAVEA